jgi:hypothetical protein
MIHGGSMILTAATDGQKQEVWLDWLPVALSDKRDMVDPVQADNLATLKKCMSFLNIRQYNDFVCPIFMYCLILQMYISPSLKDVQ